MADYYGLSALGISCALGDDCATVWRRASQGDTSGLEPVDAQLPGGVRVPFGSCAAETGGHPSRVAALMVAAARGIAGEIEAAKACYGVGRIGVVIGTSNSTMEEFTAVPDVVDMSTPAFFLRSHLGLEGPALSVSTACSSSVKAFASARKLIASGICDAVVVGGADSFSRVVVNGFNALEVTSRNLSQPMGALRDGINLGEGAALFLMERNRGEIALLGIGESSDAYHLTAPDPEGRGAEASMRAALADAKLEAKDIVYVNLHGTGTVQNDRMESQAVWRVFGANAACSSSKPLIGHTLGAAGALETALSFLMLQNGGSMLPHVLDGERDRELPELRLASRGEAYRPGPVLSNSFAFGGSNASIVIGAARIADVLPHDPPMVLLTAYDPASYTGEGLSAYVDITAQSPFYDGALDGVPAVFALEYMAQTMAALVGLKRRRLRLGPRIGFVLGSRSLKVAVDRFAAGSRYRIDAQMCFTDGSFASFDVKISAPDGTVAAEGRINAFEPEEGDIGKLKEGLA
jgi:3-oxoacyl-[acyl-carrier-protein] synthase-1